jgi:hypothetical protein
LGSSRSAGSCWRRRDGGDGEGKGPRARILRYLDLQIEHPEALRGVVGDVLGHDPKTPADLRVSIGILIDAEIEYFCEEYGEEPIL